MSTRAEECGVSYTGTFFYASSLFKATLRLSSSTLGYVEVLEANPVAQNLKIQREQFDGPLRFLHGARDR